MYDVENTYLRKGADDFDSTHIADPAAHSDIIDQDGWSKSNLPRVKVRQRKIISISDDWASFASTSGGSWRSHAGHVRTSWLRGLRHTKFRAFEAFVDDGPEAGRKIAQSLVSVRRKDLTFEDGLQILPEYEHFRGAILAELLPQLPAGRCHYGWLWALKPVPVEDFQNVAGVSKSDSKDIIVHAINLANWSDWESYYRAISNNVRRNVKAAEQGSPPVVVTRANGLAAIRLIPDLVRTRQYTLDRVNIAHRPWRMMLSCLVSILTMPSACQIAVARKGSEPLAALFGYEFGSDYYYWQGGSTDSSGGAAWKLLTDSVSYWFEKHPAGHFLMGYFDPSLPGFRREGLHRQRESLRKSDYTTQLVSFDWDPTCTKVGRDLSAKA